MPGIIYRYPQQRKFCGGPCGRWRLVVDFAPNGWDRAKSTPIYLSSWCRSCLNVRQKSPKVRAQKTQWAARQFAADRRLRFYKLPAEPLCLYLQQKVQEIGFANVAASCGVSTERIQAFVYRRYRNDGKEYEVKFVQLGTVERYMDGLGDNPLDIYPEIIDV